MMNVKNIALIILTLGVKTLYAQDPGFTQFYNNPLYTNPAFAGSAINTKDEQFATRLALNYRNQWPSLKGTYQTLNTSWDRHFSKLRGGLGAMLTRDVAGSGLVTATSVSGIYAYVIPVNKSFYIRTGLQGSYVNRRIDFSRFFGYDSLFNHNPNEPLPQNNISFFNLGFGAVAYMKNIHLGFAVHNITQPNQSFYQSVNGILPRRYTVHAGANLQIFQQSKWGNYIQPSVLFMKQQNFTQLNITTNYQIGRILVGMGFRQTLGQFGNSDAAIGIIGYKASRFQATYSYDVTVSSARSAAKGSHEIAFIYLISLKKNIPELEVMSPSY